jgi:hypothetical protein
MGYTGEIAELPVGWDGLTGTHNMSQVKPTELLIAKNVTYENGTLQKEGGASLYGTAPGGASILGGFDWWPVPGTQRQIIVCGDGKIYKDSGLGTFPVTLVSGLVAPTAPVMFAEGGKEVLANNRKLFITTGSNQMKVLSADGAAVANVASPPADWAASFPSIVVQHVNRMWGVLGHRLYYSTKTSHEDFLTGGAGGAGTIAVYPGEGDAIVAAFSYKGHLIVFKTPVGIYDVDTTDPSDANWSVQPITRAVGGVAQGLILPLDDDIIFIDKTGNVHQISAVLEYGDFGFKSTSDQALMNPFIRTNFNLSRLSFGQGIVYSAKREVHFALPDIAASTTNNRRLVLDLNSPPKIKWRYSDWVSTGVNSIWLRRDSNDIQRPVYGGSDGKVRIGDNATKQDGGNSNAGYEARFKTPHYDLSYIDPSLASKTKNGHFLELVVEPLGNWTLNVDVYWDGVFSQTIQFQTGISGATLGSFTLDTDTLGADQILNKRKRLTGSGRRISLEGYNANAGEDFSISKFLLHYTVGNERMKG